MPTNRNPDLNVRLTEEERKELVKVQKDKGYTTLSAFIRDIPKILDVDAVIEKLRKLMLEGTPQDQSFPILKLKILYYLNTRSAGGMSVDDLSYWVKRPPYEFAEILKEFKEKSYIDYYKERFSEKPIEDMRVVKLKSEGRRLAQGIFLAVNVLRDNPNLQQEIKTSHKGGYTAGIGKLVPAKTEERALVIKALKFLMAAPKYHLNDKEADEYLRRRNL